MRQDIGHNTDKIPEHQTYLEADLHKAQQKIRDSERQLEEIASQQSKWEHEMLYLRQQLQTSATKDMKFGIHQSVETLHIEAELAQVQQKATKLASKRSELIGEMQKWTNNNNDNRPKTVRMVKRDSKDRIKSPTSNGNEENQPPSLLPRGKNSNNHTFLNDQDDLQADDLSEPAEQESQRLSKSSTLPRSFKSDDLKDLKSNGPCYSGLVKPSMIHGYKRRVKIKINY